MEAESNQWGYLLPLAISIIGSVFALVTALIVVNLQSRHEREKVRLEKKQARIERIYSLVDEAYQTLTELGFEVKVGEAIAKSNDEAVRAKYDRFNRSLRDARLIIDLYFPDLLSRFKTFTMAMYQVVHLRDAIQRQEDMAARGDLIARWAERQNEMSDAYGLLWDAIRHEAHRLNQE